MDLNNAVVAITGGAGGLGLAMAERMGKQGAKLALLDINGDALEKAVAKLASLHIEARCYTLDISKEEQVETAFAAIRNDFGSLNVLVNNAGLLRDGMLLKAKEGKVTDKMSYAQWQTVIDVNLTGTFLCGREAAVTMVETGSEGVIINISSVARAGNMGQTNYSATKAGVVAMMTSWAKELARYNIRCGAIAPGVVATEILATMKPEALARLEQAVPLKRLGHPDEIAQTVEFIIQNDYFTGRTIELDGGIRL